MKGAELLWCPLTDTSERHSGRPVNGRSHVQLLWGRGLLHLQTPLYKPQMDCKQGEKHLMICGGTDTDEKVLKIQDSNKPILHEKSGHQGYMLNCGSRVINTNIKTTNH